MVFQRRLWGEALAPYQPHYPCPNCSTGRLEHATISDCTIGGLKNNSPGYPLFVRGLECELCGQLVAVHGFERKSGLIPKSMCPAPPIIHAPTKTPYSVKRELDIAFSLFWIDLGACANKLRISVERIMDHFKIEGRNLAERIAKFEKIDATHAKTFNALKQVGNVGSHIGDNTRQTILNAFEVYENALEELFGDRRAYFDRIRTKIMSKNGK